MVSLVSLAWSTDRSTPPSPSSSSSTGTGTSATPCPGLPPAIGWLFPWPFISVRGMALPASGAAEMKRMKFKKVGKQFRGKEMTNLLHLSSFCLSSSLALPRGAWKWYRFESLIRPPQRPFWRFLPSHSFLQKIKNNLIQSINQPINQSITSQSINQSTSHSINQSISHSFNQSINKSVNQSINKSINQSIEDRSRD